MTTTRTIAAGILAALVGSWGAANAQGGFGPPEIATVKVKDNIYVIRMPRRVT